VDGYQHVIVANDHGVITKINWKPQGPHPKGVTQYILATAGDGYQHVIVATNDGRITHLTWMSGSHPKGPFQDDLGSGFPTIVGVAGYYSDNDKYHHAIVATNDRVVRDLLEV
jgi:rRNA-processing protein FCF1